MTFPKIPVWIKILIVASVVWITIAVENEVFTVYVYSQPGLGGGSLGGGSLGGGSLGGGSLGDPFFRPPQKIDSHLSFDVKSFLTIYIIPLAVLWGIVWIFYDKINKKLKGDAK